MVKMKIAFCMSSLIRKFEPCWDSVVKHILGPWKDHEVDFYGHFPPTNVPVNNMIEPHVGRCQIMQEPDPELPEEWLKMTKRMLTQRHGVKGNLFQWHNMQEAAAMVKRAIADGYEYDLVLWTRPDVRINGPIEANPGTDAIYIPNHDDWHGFNDRFAYGPPGMMLTRLDMLRYFTQAWYPDGMKRHLKYGWNPERVLKDRLYMMGVPIKRTRLSVSRIRPNGKVIPPRRKSMSKLPERLG
jgi:hypothetical protein